MTIALFAAVAAALFLLLWTPTPPNRDRMELRHAEVVNRLNRRIRSARAAARRRKAIDIDLG